ncbi:hypothetical protein MLD38_010719 [Melastoma candidum]|uniref:Uncharacterized protein n=1 Tax=Melastoma candidum TaxID=119954 RepID=A0ACB9R223_9MYRT|nr:hypothetical protein MLD38_010719 [Melastoma candidum]
MMMIIWSYGSDHSRKPCAQVDYELKQDRSKLLPKRMHCSDNSEAGEAEWIKQSRGRVFCMNDEPGIYKMWTLNGDSHELAVSRAFGDYCIKGFGLISVPDISLHRISLDQDHFVWDVVSNKEAVRIVSSVPDRQSPKRLVELAASALKCRRGIAKDDITVICLFLNPLQMQQHLDVPVDAASRKPSAAM